MAFKKVVALESTIALVKQKADKNPECLVEVRVIFEIYTSCLTNVNFLQKCNIARFAEIILYHT